MKNLLSKFVLISTIAFSTSFAGLSNAANVTPDAIFGSGNANGSFTVGTSSNGAIEVGLRAKQRFPAANVFNYDGTNTYTFDAGEGSPGRPIWNYEWSINTNVNGLGGNLDNFSYSLELDQDPSAGTNFASFDPILVPFADHSIGNNGTGNGNGVEATNAGEYATLISTNNVAQNSWSIHWANALFASAFDPNMPGIYTIALSVFGDNQALLASTSIDVVVSAVPLPAALPLYAAGIAVLGFLGWKRKKASA